MIRFGCISDLLINDQLACDIIDKYKPEKFIFKIPIKSRNLKACLKYLESTFNNNFSYFLIEAFVKMIGEYQKTTVLNQQDYVTLIIKIIEKHNHLLFEIPRDFWTPDTYQAIIDKAPKTMTYAYHLVEQEIFTQDQIQNIFMHTVKKNSNLISHLKNYKSIGLSLQSYSEICLEAVKENANTIQYIHQDAINMSLYQTAVEQNGSALQYIKLNNNIQESEYIELCFLAVERTPSALQYVDDKYKLAVIDALDLERIAQLDYGMIEFIPDSYPKKKELIKKIADNTSNIVITQYDDKEFKDTYLVYANHLKRKGKTIHVNTAGLNYLLSTISPQASINLVLLGHATHKAEKLAGIDANKINSILIDNEMIQRVTLLGCHSAVSKPLAKEQEMISDYKQRHTYAGLLIANELPDPSKYEDYFKKMKVDKNQHTANKFFILVHSRAKTSSPVLLEITKGTDDVITENKYDLDKNKLDNIAPILGKNKGKIPYAPKKNVLYNLVGGKNSVYLNHEQSLRMIGAACGYADIFHREHPEYKQRKNEYPFLAGLEIGQDEADVIQPSLLKLFSDKIKSEPKITRDIVVKGYTQSVHVDIQEQQMKMARTYLYSKKYKESKTPKFFSQKGKEDNIERKKLREERRKNIDAMAKGETEEESKVKSIKLHTKRHK